MSDKREQTTLADTVVLISIFRESLIGGVAVHSSNLYDRLVENEVPVEKINYADVFQQQGLARKVIGAVRMGFRLLRLRLKGVKIFHFHASNQALVFYFFGPLLALIGGRVILSIHSGYGFDRWLKEHPVYDFVNQLAFRSLSNLVFMNPEESERISRRYPFLQGRIRTVNPFIAPTRKELGGATRAQPAADTFRMVTIGAWGRRYNVEEAVEAAALLQQKIEDRVSITVMQSTALIEPEYQEELQRRFEDLSNEIEITVLEDVPEVLPVLARHDVFVRPSKGDSYGLCVAEALVVGTPAIVTDICRRCSTAVLYRQGEMDTLVGHLLEAYHKRKTNTGENLLPPSEDSYTGYVATYTDLK